MITKLTTLAREIREVIPGTDCISLHASGSVMVIVSTDEHVRSFAAASGEVVHEVETLGVRWLQCDAGADDEPIMVAGPTHKVEQTAEVTP